MGGGGGKVDRKGPGGGLLCMNTKPRTLHHQSPGGERRGKKKC